MRDAGHRTPDAGHRTAKKAKIIYPPPRGVDIMSDCATLSMMTLVLPQGNKKPYTHLAFASLFYIQFYTTLLGRWDNSAIFETMFYILINMHCGQFRFWYQMHYKPYML